MPGYRIHFTGVAEIAGVAGPGPMIAGYVDYPPRSSAMTRPTNEAAMRDCENVISRHMPVVDVHIHSIERRPDVVAFDQKITFIGDTSNA